MNLYRTVGSAVACVAAITLSACGGESTPNTPQSTPSTSTSSAAASTTFTLPVDAPDILVELSSGIALSPNSINNMFREEFGVRDIQLEQAKEKWGGKKAAVGAFEKDCYIFLRQTSDDDPRKFDITIDKRSDGMAEVLLKTNSDNPREAAEYIDSIRAICK